MRLLARFAAVSAALVLTVVTVPTAAAATPYPWGGVATYPTNRTVDTTAYAGGIWSNTDRWADATGANLDGKHREDYYKGLPEAATLTYDAFGAHRSARNGDYVPPQDDARFPELSADIVFTQLHPSATGLDVRVVLTSLGQKDSSILTLALATGSGTGDSSLPRGAGLTCTGCGVDRYVTVWGSGSEIATPDGNATGTVQDLVVDPTENTISFHVPDIGATGSTLRAWLASGLNDSTGHYLTVQPSQSTTAPGGGNGAATNVFDLAFVHDNRTAVDERVQSDLLASGEIGPGKVGGIGPAAAIVDLAALRRGARRVEGEPTGGPVERVLVSSSNQGDGIDSGNAAATFQNPGAGQNFHYLGRLQGYLVDLPPGWRRGHAVPEVMELHGYNGFYDEEYFLAPQERAAVEKAGYLGVYPLGRGDVQYEHDGELDVLEVQRAVEQDYAVDPARVHLVGISMGGFGATKLAVRHADVFADASVFVGGEEGDANVVNDHLTSYPITRAVEDVVGNLQDTPLLLGASAADADAAGGSASVVYEQLRGVGDEAHVKQYLAGTHEPAIIDLAVPQMVPQWQRSVRAAVPARVRYGFDTSWDFGALVDDGSAWLRDLRPAADPLGVPGTQGTGSAEALTLPRTLTALSETQSQGGSVADRSAYVLRDSLRYQTGSRPVSNALSLSLAGVRSGSVDLAPLRVDTARRYCIDLSSDGPAAVRLTGLRLSGLDVAGVPATRSGDDLVLAAPAGTTHAVLAPHGVPAALGTPCPAAGGSTGRSAAAPGTAGTGTAGTGTAGTGTAGTGTAGTGTADTGSPGPGSAGPGTAQSPTGTASSALPTTGPDVLPPLVGLVLLMAALWLARRRTA